MVATRGWVSLFLKGLSTGKFLMLQWIAPNTHEHMGITNWTYQVIKNILNKIWCWEREWCYMLYIDIDRYRYIYWRKKIRGGYGHVSFLKMYVIIKNEERIVKLSFVM